MIKTQLKNKTFIKKAKRRNKKKRKFCKIMEDFVQFLKNKKRILKVLKLISKFPIIIQIIFKAKVQVLKKLFLIINLKKIKNVNPMPFKKSA